MGEQVRLRPIEEHHLTHLVRLLWDPEAPGEYQWFGFQVDEIRGIGRRWRDDGLIGEDSSLLAVELEDGTCAGWVTCRAVRQYFPKRSDLKIHTKLTSTPSLTSSTDDLDKHSTGTHHHRHSTRPLR